MERNRKFGSAGFLSFLLLVEIFYFYNRYTVIGGFGVGYQYLGCIAVVLLGGTYFLLHPDPPYLGQVIGTAGILALPYFLAMVYSVTLWTFQFTPIRQIISGFFEPGYMILCIVCAAFLIYLLGENTVECSFWALSAALCLLVFQKLREFGVSEYVRRLANYLLSVGENSGGVSLENTSFSYVYVFFALYFLFHRQTEPLWKRLLRWSMVFLGLAEVFKRSALLALSAGLLAAFLYARTPDRHKRLFRNIIMVILLLFAVLIIPAIRSGLFTRIVNELHINTSARIRIYAYYNQYYEFTPLYFGKGLGWIQRLVSASERFNVGLESVNVHCDYVRFYIELGFWGYLFWLLPAIPLVITSMVKGKSVPDAAVILGLCVSMAVLRFTENVSQLYSANLGLAIVILQCHMNSWRREEGTYEMPGTPGTTSPGRAGL